LGSLFQAEYLVEKTQAATILIMRYRLRHYRF
jgi:hypothetical protein